jgi:putative FmdB family regulatory protein
MPTYEYKCASCSHTLEAFQKISEEPLKECPQCKKESLQRGIGGGGATFQFKGKGFYITDYKQSPQKPEGSCCPCGKNSGACEKN